MALSTIETSETLQPKTSTDLRNVTFSQALAAGRTHSGWLTGPRTDPAGRDRVLASHSVPPANAKALMTSGTCGPLFASSSPSADLQRSLASRLRARLDVGCSPEYVLTWKQWDMESGPPICALRARRTSDNDCGGWPTPEAENWHGYQNSNGKRYLRTGSAAQLCGWLTPKCPSGSGRAIRTTPGGGLRKLEDQVLTAGWPSPTALSFKDSHQPSNNRSMNKTKELCGWATPTTVNHRSPKSNQHGRNTRPLQEQAGLAGWATPCKHDETNMRVKYKQGGSPLPYQAGLTTPSSPAPTANNGVLEPGFTRWLMGYPVAWDAHAPYSKQWDTAQQRLSESFDNREAFWQWLVEIGLAA